MFSSSKKKHHITLAVVIVAMLSTYLYFEVREGRDGRLGNAAIMNTLHNIQTHASTYYTNQGSYEGMCEEEMIQNMSLSIEKQAKVETTCLSSAQTWVVFSELRFADYYYCVDHLGHRATRTKMILVDGIQSCVTT